MRVLSWNLYHGRAAPPAGRPLFEEFAAVLGGWRWDVALLQEVPPWWPEPLGRRLGASARSVLTSRNSLLTLRRWVAERRPDQIKSNGGGCNAILVHGADVTADRRLRLRRLPERRWLHAVRLDSGTWIGNLHAQGSKAEALRAGEALRSWAAGEPAVLGGDFNLTAVSLPGFAWLGGRGVDHVLGCGLACEGFEVLAHGALSDHAPVLCSTTAKPLPRLSSGSATSSTVSDSC